MKTKDKFFIEVMRLSPAGHNFSTRALNLREEAMLNVIESLTRRIEVLERKHDTDE